MLGMDKHYKHLAIISVSNLLKPKNSKKLTHTEHIIRKCLKYCQRTLKNKFIYTKNGLSFLELEEGDIG